MLRGARAAGVGVGRGCGLQGARAGLRGRQRRGRAAISGVCVEVQPPVSFAQRQIISFAKTGAFPPPETQGETGAGRTEASGGKSETEAELRKQAARRAASPPLPSSPPLRAGLAEREVHGGPPCFRVLQHPKVGSLPRPAMQVCVTSAAPSTHRLRVVLAVTWLSWLLLLTLLPQRAASVTGSGNQRARLRVLPPRSSRFTRTLKADTLSHFWVCPWRPTLYHCTSCATSNWPLRVPRLTRLPENLGCGCRVWLTRVSEAGSGPSLVSLASPRILPCFSFPPCPLPVPSLAPAVSV